LTPGGAAAPDSVTVAASFAGSVTKALVFGGIVTSSVKRPASRFHEVRWFRTSTCATL